MNDTDAANMIKMMLLGKMPRFTEQEISMMNTDMRTPAQKYQDSRLELAMMNADVGQNITKPRVSPQFAAEMADKIMRENYDPDPDVGSIQGTEPGILRQLAGDAAFAMQDFGKSAQDAGPLGYLAGSAIESTGDIAQKYAYGESDWYDPLLLGLNALALTPGAFMSSGMRSAMKSPDAKYSIFKELFGN